MPPLRSNEAKDAAFRSALARVERRGPGADLNQIASELIEELNVTGDMSRAAVHGIVSRAAESVALAARMRDSPRGRFREATHPRLRWGVAGGGGYEYRVVVRRAEEADAAAARAVVVVRADRPRTGAEVGAEAMRMVRALRRGDPYFAWSSGLGEGDGLRADVIAAFRRAPDEE